MPKCISKYYFILKNCIMLKFKHKIVFDKNLEMFLPRLLLNILNIGTHFLIICYNNKF